MATLDLTATAMGDEVTVVMLFWAIKKLGEGMIDELDFSPEYASSASEAVFVPPKHPQVFKISQS